MTERWPKKEEKTPENLSFFVKKFKLPKKIFSYAKILGETNFQPREFPRSGSKAKDGKNTPGTRGGPGGRDRTLAVKKKKVS